MSGAGRAAASALAAQHVPDGDPLGWFEPLCAAAVGDAGRIPWADRGPR